MRKTAIISRPFPTHPLTDAPHAQAPVRQCSRVVARGSRSDALGHVLAAAERELAACRIDTPRLDAEVLLADALQLDRTALYARLAEPVSVAQRAAFRQRLARRARREPVAYITGRQEFWSLEFAVRPGVLIPRADTELVVETSLSLFEAPRTATPRIADIGTGSGCLAIALATELPYARLWAVDRSATALSVTRRNARAQRVDGRIHVWRGDLLDAVAPVRLPAGGFDLIVANPPYVDARSLDQAGGLAPEVREWEPRAALDGGPDGLDCYRRLLGGGAHTVSDHLRPGGWFVTEIGHEQHAAVRALGHAHPALSFVRCVQDYAGRDRVVVFRKSA